MVVKACLLSTLETCQAQACSPRRRISSACGPDCCLGGSIQTGSNSLCHMPQNSQVNDGYQEQYCRGRHYLSPLCKVMLPLWLLYYLLCYIWYFICALSIWRSNSSLQLKANGSQLTPLTLWANVGRSRYRVVTSHLFRKSTALIILKQLAS